MSVCAFTANILTHSFAIYLHIHLQLNRLRMYVCMSSHVEKKQGERAAKFIALKLFPHTLTKSVEFRILVCVSEWMLARQREVIITERAL